MLVTTQGADISGEPSRLPQVIPSPSEAAYGVEERVLVSPQIWKRRHADISVTCQGPQKVKGSGQYGSLIPELSS